MFRLDFKNDEVILTPEFKLAKEFDNILKKVPKKRANQILLYIFLMCDRSDQNLLRDVEAVFKEEQCLSRAFNSASTKFSEDEQALIADAMTAYRIFNDTPEDRLLRSIDLKMEQLSTMLNSTTPEIQRNVSKDNSVSFSSNLKIITDAIKEISNLMATKEKVTANIMKLKLNKREKISKPSLLESGRI
jgi:seryl-tRNA synthetase